MSNHGSMSVSKVLFSPSSRFISFATSRSVSRLCFELTRVLLRTLALSLPENPVLLKISILSHLPHRPPFRTSAQYSIIFGFSPKFQEGQTPKRQLNILQNNKGMKNSSFWVVFIVMHIAFPFSNFLFENNRKMALLVSSHLDRLNSLIFNYPSFPRCRFSFSNTGDLNFLNIQSVK